MYDKQSALQAIEDIGTVLKRVSDEVWENPETAFTEVKSSEAHKKALRELGFTVEENLADIPTAFSGTWGHGHPVIGILGEFDALNGLSQEAGIAEHSPVIPGGNGHGCGHNLFGAGSIGAAYGIMQYLKNTGKEGTVIYFGCPGEEGGSGKAFMARDGVFDGLDLALTWHPGGSNVMWSSPFLANYQIKYKYTGLAAHAGACPELGRSALDAVELLNVGVQFLREHIISSARIHYAITDTGGFSPNVVQPYAEVLYLIRAPKVSQVQEIYERVNKIAEGAAMMTETHVEREFMKACSDYISNATLCEVMQKNMEELPPQDFDDADKAFAKAINDTVTLKTDPFAKVLADCTPEVRERLLPHRNEDLLNVVMPLNNSKIPVTASTDVGDVSHVCPTAQVSTTCWATQSPGHSWQIVAQGKSPAAFKGLMFAAKIIAATAIDLINSPETIEQAKAELDEEMDHQKYVPPIPKGVVPAALKKN